MNAIFWNFSLRLLTPTERCDEYPFGTTTKGYHFAAAKGRRQLESRKTCGTSSWIAPTLDATKEIGPLQAGLLQHSMGYIYNNKWLPAFASKNHISLSTLFSPGIFAALEVTLSGARFSWDGVERAFKFYDDEGYTVHAIIGQRLLHRAGSKTLSAKSVDSNLRCLHVALHEFVCLCCKKYLSAMQLQSCRFILAPLRGWIPRWVECVQRP